MLYHSPCADVPMCHVWNQNRICLILNLTFFRLLLPICTPSFICLLLWIFSCRNGIWVSRIAFARGECAYVYSNQPHLYKFGLAALFFFFVKTSYNNCSSYQLNSILCSMSKSHLVLTINWMMDLCYVSLRSLLLLLLLVRKLSGIWIENRTTYVWLWNDKESQRINQVDT